MLKKNCCRSLSMRHRQHALAAHTACHAVCSPCCSWCGCNNSALFAELVPEEQRSTIYAFDRSFEVGSLLRFVAQCACAWNGSSLCHTCDFRPGPAFPAFVPSLQGAVGALGAPLVGLAAELMFGFKGVLGGAGMGSGRPATGRIARTFA